MSESAEHSPASLSSNLLGLRFMQRREEAERRKNLEKVRGGRGAIESRPRR